MSVPNSVVPNSRSLVVVLLVLALFGIVTFLKMPRDIDPELPNRRAQVVAFVPGITPSQIEERVTLPIERAIADLSGLANIGATSGLGHVVVSLELEPASVAQTTAVLDSVRERIERLRGQLSTQIPYLSGPWLESTETFGLFDSVLVLGPATGVAAGDSDKTLSSADLDRHARSVADLLRADPAITRSRVFGGQQSAVYISYDDEDLRNAGLTPSSLAERLRVATALLPGGYVEEDGRILAIQVPGSGGDLKSLREMPIRDPRDGSTSRLGDVCDIELSPVSPGFGGIIVRGTPAIGIAVKRHGDADPESYAEAIRGAQNGQEIREAGLVLRSVLDRPTETASLISRTSRLVLISSLLVFAMVTLCMGLRSGFAVACALVLTLGISFLVLGGLGISWNVITLAALSVAVGLIVDNHIVLAHQARRRAADHQEEPTPGRSLRSLGWPLLVAMLTTLAAFLPTWLLRGGAGEYVASLAVVVGVCLTVSLIIGFVVTPSLSVGSRGLVSRLRRPFVVRTYSQFLERLLARGSWAAIAVPIVFGFIGWLAWGGLDRAPLPAIDSTADQSVEITFPVGTSREIVAKATSELVEGIYKDTYAGPAPVSFLGADPAPVFRGMAPRLPNPCQATVLLPGASSVLETVTIPEAWSKRYPLATVRTGPLGLTPRLRHAVGVRLTGRDRQSVTSFAAKAVEMHRDGWLSDLSLSSPELESVSSFRVDIDLEEVAGEGFTPVEVASGAAANSSGVPVMWIQTEQSGGRVPVLLRQSTDENMMTTLEEAYIHRGKGNPLFLEDLAEIEEQELPTRLSRWNGRPAVEIRGASLGNAIASEIELLDSLSADAPSGLLVESSGSLERSEQPMRRVLAMLPIIAIAIVILLLIQTKSGAATAAICLNFLPAVAGSILALAVTGQPFGIMALLGMVTVGGIMVNNAVLMLDRMRRERAFGVDEVSRVAAERFTPVVVTAGCTLLGVLPLALSGNALWAPFTIALIGGILASTISTLIWIPGAALGGIGEDRRA